MGAAVIAATSLGVAAGFGLSYLFGRYVARKLSADSASQRSVVRGAVGGAALMLLPAFFLSFVAGGNLGGGWGSALGQQFGLERLGVVVGLAVGICAVLWIVVSAGALLGAFLGRGVASFGSPNNRSRGP